MQFMIVVELEGIDLSWQVLEEKGELSHGFFIGEL